MAVKGGQLDRWGIITICLRACVGLACALVSVGLSAAVLKGGPCWHRARYAPRMDGK